MADEGETAQQASGDKWGVDVTLERKAWLEERLQAWEVDHGKKRGPFYGENLTGADVFWLAARTRAKTNEPQTVARQMERLRQTRANSVRAANMNLDGLHLEGVNLHRARLEEAILTGVHLEGAVLSGTYLKGACLYKAHLEGATLFEDIFDETDPATAHWFPAHLEGATLSEAYLEGADLYTVDLSGADLTRAHVGRADLTATGLEWADLSEANLAGTNLARARLAGADLREAHLEGAYLVDASLERAILYKAHLEGANLFRARLSGATLAWAHLEGADLAEAHLEGKRWRADDADYQRITRLMPEKRTFPVPLLPAVLRGAFFDGATDLSGTVLGDRRLGSVVVGDIHWGSVNLTVVDWSRVGLLGDVPIAQSNVSAASPFNDKGSTTPSQAERGKTRHKKAMERIEEYLGAARANRQLATALRSQGIADEADRFAYRAQRCQRVAMRKQHRYLSYIGSLLLDLLAGYGFRPGRAILLYLAVILWFANFYVWASHGLFSLGLPPTHVQPLAWYEGLILSVSSFHGRGFQPFQNLNDPIAALAGMQAVFGLIIEVSFIATFTQRFFAR